MTALSACSGGAGGEDGKPVAAAIVHDSNRPGEAVGNTAGAVVQAPPAAAPAAAEAMAAVPVAAVPPQAELPLPPQAPVQVTVPHEASAQVTASAPAPSLVVAQISPALVALPPAPVPVPGSLLDPSNTTVKMPSSAPLLIDEITPALPGTALASLSTVPSPTALPPLTAPPTTLLPRPPVVVAPPGGLAPLPPSLPIDSASGQVTDIHVTSTAAAEQLAVPLTFGQVFAQGDVAASQQLVGKLADGRLVPLQLDVKARHPDGSARHAIISATLPKVAAAQTQRIILAKGSASGSGAAPTAAALLAAGFSAGVQIDLAGVRYTASADSLLRSGKVTPWLAGPVTTEWLVAAPLVKSDGTPHPHLAARFAIRTYSGVKQARVDVTIENNWAFEPAPRDFKYDANLLVGGRSVYKKAGLTHYHHARWRKVLWWGNEPALHVVHNVGYLIGTRALPNYDRSVRVSNARLESLKNDFSSKGHSEPMAVGLAATYMPATGGRDDIGLLPGWAATYLLTMDQRAKQVTLGTADLAGTWSIHYRDKLTDRPVSLHDYPYMTVAGQKGDTFNPVTKKYENFPACAAEGACANANAHDVSHQPNFAYLPYIVTGDHYYLEELQFWGMFDAFMSNPGYRQGISGLVKPEQVRGQAWGLRSLANAAYITPDSDPLKKPLDAIVKANLKWYNDNYTFNAQANKLGVLSHGYAIVYANNTGLAPWMDDFFTSAVGHVAELGYRDALPLLKWKAKFPIGRMTAPNVCWVTGAMYSMKVRDKADGALYGSLATAWKASTPLNLLSAPCGSQAMATTLGLTVGEMTGYSKSTAGYPANMQPALAYAADVGGSEGAAAWQRFMARSVKPDYGNGPAFAIVPR